VPGGGIGKRAKSPRGLHARARNPSYARYIRRFPRDKEDSVTNEILPTSMLSPRS
jgi:hypothetical protein